MDFDNKGAMTVQEFQAWASVSHTTVYRLINEGKLKAVKSGRRTLITSQAANDFIANLPAVKAAG